MWSRVSNTCTSGLSESVKPTFLGSEVCNELYYWATRSRKTCLKRISNLLCLQSHSLIVTGFRCNASSNPSFGSNPSPSRWSTLAPCSGRSPPAKAAPAAKPAPAKCHLRCKPSSLFRVLLRPPNCRSGISEPIIYSLHLQHPSFAFSLRLMSVILNCNKKQLMQQKVQL